MKNNFEMSMMGELKFFLGLQVHQFSPPPCRFINQSQYAIELLKKYGLDECVSMSTPMATERAGLLITRHLSTDQNLLSSYEMRAYVKNSQSTIHSFAYFCDVARYQHVLLSNPTKEVNRTFVPGDSSYNMGLWYPKDSRFELIAYSDADHAGCKDDCKSTSGGLQFLEYSFANYLLRRFPKERFEYLYHRKADVHPDELCLPNKRYDLMDANKKVELDHVQSSSSVPWIYMAQFWHTLKEDRSKYWLSIRIYNRVKDTIEFQDYWSSAAMANVMQNILQMLNNTCHWMGPTAVADNENAVLLCK
ncbi:hypothetical protein Tco_0710687 [Tanacetum coccineum]